jgi:hypothetical protein
MDFAELARWQQEAEAAATKAKIPPGPMRESFIRINLRIRVAKLNGIEGLSTEGKP